MPSNRHRSRFQGWPLLVVSLTAGAAPIWPGLSGPTAHAQMIQFVDERIEADEPHVTRRDIKELIKTLQLDDDQQQVLDALYGAHRDAFKAELSAAGEERRAAREVGHDPDNWAAQIQKMQEIDERWDRRAAELETEFFNNVLALLNDEQKERWPLFERDRRRRTVLAGDSQLSSEGIDLTEILDGLELPAADAERIAPLVSAYADEIDKALSERTTALDRLDAKSPEPGEMTGGSDSDFDEEAFREEMGRVLARRVALRDINIRYAGLLSDQLGSDLGGHLLDEFQKQSFPRIYRETGADRYIEAVRQKTGLAEDQLAALDMIEQDYQRQAEGLHEQMVAVIRKDEASPSPDDPIVVSPRGRGRPFRAGDGGAEAEGDVEYAAVGIAVQIDETSQGGGSETRGDGPVNELRFKAAAPAGEGGGMPILSLLPTAEEDENSPLGKLHKQKRELVVRTVDSVHGLLTPDQQALAPKPGSDDLLEPEERLRRKLAEAMQNAVIETSEDGSTSMISVEVGEDGSAGEEGKDGN